MDEFEIIAKYFAPLAGEGAFGLSDDAALLAARPGEDLIVTTDAISAGVDFFDGDPPAAVAKKALRVNLSDLAAKGAVPAHYLLNLLLPPKLAEDAWLKDFAQGLAQDQKEFAISLLGGDMSASDGALSISVVAFGYLPRGAMVHRYGAQTGDHVYVTGTIGDSGAGLALLKDNAHGLSREECEELISRYRVPRPPVSFAAKLRAIAHAAVDISDGLVADLNHLAQSSGKHLCIDAERVPLSPSLFKLWGEEAVLRAATAGDDYQIAFTASPGCNGPFTRIGQVEEGSGVSLMRKGRRLAVAKPGYRHF